MKTKALPQEPVLAPDGSEIRELVVGARASMVHCTLAPGAVSRAVAHRTVEELWFVLKGKGEVWRKLGTREETIEARPGTSLDVPLSAHFQFRNTGDGALEILIVTMPPWPGAAEAYRVPDHWPSG